MKGKNTITINGRLYDALTGLPVKEEVPRPASAAHHRPHPAPAHKKPGVSGPHRAFSDIAPSRQPLASVSKVDAAKTEQPAANSVHKPLQKTTTLNRTAVKRPAALSIARPKTTRSPHISKFGPSLSMYAPKLQPVTEEVQDVPAPDQPEQPVVHPVAARAAQRRSLENIQAQAKAEAAQSSKELKEQLIKARLSEVDASKNQKRARGGRLAVQPRIATVVTSALTLLLLGGYLTYINLPNLSMRVAATRAGIAARFPNYQPDGYRFDGPIQYAPGQVTINFRSNTNDNKFTVTQKASNWDSQSVLDNLVNKESSAYLTYQERGLTIYTYNNKATWVSGGLLYSVEGNAQLSSEQVLKLATSIWEP